MRVVACALTDVHVALTEVSREEIEEIAEVGLGVAHLAISMAQRAARRMLNAVERECGDGVIIEDLGETDEALRRVSRGSGDAAGGEVYSSSQHLLWQPLWPRLRSWCAEPSLPELRVPAALIAVLVVAWPVALLCAFLSFWIVVFVLPGALLLDAGVQRLYLARQAPIDEFAEATRQCLKLWYLTARLAVRRTSRVARAQLRRALGGRPLSGAARDWARHPWSSAWAGARFGARVTASLVREAWGMAGKFYRVMPSVHDGRARAEAHVHSVRLRLWT